MSKIKLVAVFSDNRETQSTYISFGNLKEANVLFKAKNKTSLQALVEQDFDIVFVEILQPVMSEIDYIDQVYGITQGKVPIIVISSYFYDTKDLVFGTKIGDFIPKPLTVDKLLDSSKLVMKTAAEPAAIATLPAQGKMDDVLKEGKKLSVLLEISRSLSSKTNFDDLLHSIISLAADTLNAERATLFILDKKRKELWSRSGLGIEQQTIRIPANKGIAGEVAQSGQAQIIDDPYNHPKFNKEVDVKTGFKTRNILTLPMKNIQGEVIGVFQILNKKDGSFTSEDQVFLNAMAASTGIAIENALLHDELKHQLQEVKKAYEDLYVAQKQILKDAKNVTINEITHFIRESLSKGRKLPGILKQIRKNYADDLMLNSLMEAAEADQVTALKKIEQFVEEQKSKLQ